MPPTCREMCAGNLPTFPYMCVCKNHATYICGDVCKSAFLPTLPYMWVDRFLHTYISLHWPLQESCHLHCPTCRDTSHLSLHVGGRAMAYIALHVVKCRQNGGLHVGVLPTCGCNTYISLHLGWCVHANSMPPTCSFMVI